MKFATADIDQLPEAGRTFYRAALDDVLSIPECQSCGLTIWYPRTWCPECGSDDVVWQQHDGAGSVYSCTVLSRSMSPDEDPMGVAYIQLDAGPLILGRVLTDDPTAVAIGSRVRARFIHPEDQLPVLAFVLAEGADGAGAPVEPLTGE